MPHWNRIDWPVEKMRHWYEVEEKTVAEIGAILGRNPKVVNKVCKKHGFRMRPRGQKFGPKHKGWKGGRRIDKDGYVLIYCPDHPSANGRRKTVREHRLVMEQHLGRFLLPTEVVHHKDENKLNNDISNLELFSTNAEHLAETLKGKCPNWTPEGRARTLAGTRKPRKKRATQEVSALDVLQSP